MLVIGWFVNSKSENPGKNKTKQEITFSADCHNYNGCGWGENRAGLKHGCGGRKLYQATTCRLLLYGCTRLSWPIIYRSLQQATPLPRQCVAIFEQDNVHVCMKNFLKYDYM